ncbi:UDP-2,3-diacylglucosamine diphosphatase [Fontimonas sp. SYSU GA230001]|uniref:UDP-2,3-diacylglucosamine diphosphatase n=1 Tax=Fontimonas sp. SYSU GA230001 TaxID=3142450 RepID=UPI0032B5AE92
MKQAHRLAPDAGGRKVSRRRPRDAGKTHYRTIWISDVHLGTAGCKAEHLVDFLKQHTCDRLYLVGDIIDGWKLRSGWYWPQEHTNVVRKVLTKAKRETEVIYVTGNHDEFLRKFVDYRLELGNIRLVNEAVHTTADGRRLLVTHGDFFDVITRYHRWIALAGDALYEGTMRFSLLFNRIRARFGLGYWSLSAFAKQHVKTAVNIVSTFEDSLARECRRRKFDGVVCGHIHHAEARDIGGVMYYNCGDWVESCTALTEDMNGRLQIVRWVQLDHLNQTSPKVTPLAKVRAVASA